MKATKDIVILLNANDDFLFVGSKEEATAKIKERGTIDDIILTFSKGDEIDLFFLDKFSKEKQEVFKDVLEMYLSN